MTWNKGGSSLCVSSGWISDAWEERLLQRRRNPGVRNWRAGDYLMLDVDSYGRYGMGTRLEERPFALVKTFRYRFDDRSQPGTGERLKRWFDYLMLRRVYRRGRFGWRVVQGTWDLFGTTAMCRRYEWRVMFRE